MDGLVEHMARTAHETACAVRAGTGGPPSLTWESLSAELRDEALSDVRALLARAWNRSLSPDVQRPFHVVPVSP